MSGYINFETNLNDPGLRGNPVFDGKLPARYLDVQGVRVSGEEVTFAQPDFVERLHHALVDGPKLANSRGEGFDCFSFALLMAGVDLVQAAKGRDFEVDPVTDYDFEFDGDDPAQRLPVAIGAKYHDTDPIYFHTAYPAHSTDEARYIHLLGDSGPVCLSSLDEAEEIVGGRLSAVITAMTVTVEDEQVAMWQAPVLPQ